ncbi:hypothetical protein [Prevotella sp. P6B1]|uniref:hypothetical protein n=1 Tax=Prevotella sp. P6B1 TaxID=1410613 RepID=UPI00051AC538|nr:hypothetical protein [Prevotella sp. P6B1]
MDKLVNDAIEKKNKDYYEYSRNLNIWHCASLSKKNFWQLLKANAETFMAERGIFRSFIVDDDNKEIIHQMWLYATGSKDCKWDINKGIYIGGKVGCGKTILMRSFCEILHFISGNTVEMIPAPELCYKISEKGYDSFASRPLFIDEVGREPMEMKAFGNTIHPIKELIAIRYNKGARTFFTSNFKITSLSKWRDEKGNLVGYGQDIGDRIREMMNIVEMTGESRREYNTI